MDFTQLEICSSRRRCVQCRKSPEWRKMFNAPDVCPFGIEDSPTLLNKAKSLATAAGDWVRAGLPVTSDADLENRLNICKTCEFWDQSGFMGTGSCKKCGCSTQAKLRMATAKCPIDKWLAEDIKQAQ